MLIFEVLRALLLALALMTGDGGTAVVDVDVDVDVDDGSARVTLTYVAPRCPVAHDEPCYVVVLVDHEDGIHDVDAGP